MAIDFTEIKAVLEDVKTKVGPLVAAVEAEFNRLARQAGNAAAAPEGLLAIV